MKWLSIQSTQARLGLLIGVFVVAAALNAVLAIRQAAEFQGQLVELKYLASQVEQHNAARISLTKQQDALKKAAISVDGSSAVSGDFKRYGNIFLEYLSDPGHAMDEAEFEAFNQIGDRYLEQNENAINTMFSGERLTLELTAALDQTVAELDTAINARIAADQQTFREALVAIESYTRQSALTGQVALGLLALLVVWGVYTTLDISRPIHALTSAIVAFENNTFKPGLLAAFTRRKDELGQLSQAVSSMAQSISESNRLTEQFLQAAQRFVPSQYLEFLEKDNITKVRLGDHVSAEMAVMFSDIRGFTSMSERMTAKENFDFVNEYLKLVSPVIQKHDGFIVKFLGDGMMAIFPYGVEDAVKAGIEKGLLVQEFNQSLAARGLGSITVGIGIHTGPMMVGMIGEELRMQGDAFSDNVNLTSRIEGLNKFYGTSMIISEETLQQLPDPASHKIRYLGKAVVKGRITPLGMYEVYEGLAPKVIAARDAVKAEFERALALYAEGCLAEAGELFSQVLARDPSDKTARLYLESCAEWLDQPRPDDWTGAIVMDAK